MPLLLSPNVVRCEDPADIPASHSLVCRLDVQRDILWRRGLISNQYRNVAFSGSYGWRYTITHEWGERELIRLQEMLNAT